MKGDVVTLRYVLTGIYFGIWDNNQLRNHRDGSVSRKAK